MTGWTGDMPTSAEMRSDMRDELARLRADNARLVAENTLRQGVLNAALSKVEALAIRIGELEGERDFVRAKAFEEAAKAVEWAHTQPPDGGSPSEDEHAVAQNAAAICRNLAARAALAQGDGEKG